METLNVSQVLREGQVQWEIGMGAPALALFQSGFFKHVVATEAAFDVYSQVIFFFENYADAAEKKQIDIEKIHEHSHSPTDIGRRQTRRSTIDQKRQKKGGKGLSLL